LKLLVKTSHQHHLTKNLYIQKEKTQASLPGSLQLIDYQLT